LAGDPRMLQDDPAGPQSNYKPRGAKPEPGDGNKPKRSFFGR
jgi:hypothetical protein